MEWLPAELGNNPVIHALIPREFVTSVLRNAYRTPRGREYARKIVFREVSFADCIRVPPMLVVGEGIRQGAMPEAMTEEQDALVWQLVDDGYTAATQTGKIGRRQLLQLALAWTGVTGPFGWQGVAPTLEPRLRGPIAYVLGHRYLRLKRPTDAAALFQTALDSAPPGSSLETLARKGGQ